MGRGHLGCVHHGLWWEICCGGLILKGNSKTGANWSRFESKTPDCCRRRKNRYAIVRGNASKLRPDKKQEPYLSQDTVGWHCSHHGARYLFLGGDTCSFSPALLHSGTLKHNLLFFFFIVLSVSQPSSIFSRPSLAFEPVRSFSADIYQRSVCPYRRLAFQTGVSFERLGLRGRKNVVVLMRNVWNGGLKMWIN